MGNNSGDLGLEEMFGAILEDAIGYLGGAVGDDDVGTDSHFVVNVVLEASRNGFRGSDGIEVEHGFVAGIGNTVLEGLEGAVEVVMLGFGDGFNRVEAFLLLGVNGLGGGTLEGFGDGREGAAEFIMGTVDFIRGDGVDGMQVFLFGINAGDVYMPFEFKELFSAS